MIRFIRTQWGSILNLSHIEEIFIREEENKIMIVAIVGSVRKIMAECKNKVEAQAYIDSIFNFCNGNESDH